MSKTISPAIAVRGTTGISISTGPPENETVKAFEKDLCKTCKCMRWSPYGDYFAWANGIKVTIVRTSDWSVLVTLDKPRVAALDFSPKGTYLATWEVFTTSPTTPQGTQNVNVYETSTGNHLGSFEQRKQSDWEPQWSADETICVRNVKNDLLFHKSSNLNEVDQKFANQRVHSFSISPAPNPFHVLCYIPGKQGQPSLGKLFEYPKFDSPVASKSFFQADTVDTFWNKKGSGVLLQTNIDVDKKGTSYYGTQTLHFLSIKGDTSMVQLSKEGPIHSVAWSPLSTEFTVMYGFMPAKATIFNMKCEPVFELGVGPRNSIYYNPHGNILLLGGFGNLQGSVELWDAPNKKFINKLLAPDTTLLEWSPQGTHFLTATTAPRLRMSNGYKIWHHSGALVYERPWSQQEELWEVGWQRFKDGTFKTPAIAYKPIEGITPSAPQASKEVYRPPTARGKPVSFKLNEELDNALPAAAQPSKAALKQKKKREAKKAAKAAAADDDEPQESPIVKSSNPLVDISSEDPEKRKKIGRIKSKLGEIERLKDQQKSGKALEVNQLEKIKKESSLLDELRALAL
uniref:Eukaryotic translation initiation factor 2A n=1 Tax=Lygus hesperus TaxID=30085 RepID=A0A0A9WRR4_LYGHE